MKFNFNWIPVPKTKQQKDSLNKTIQKRYTQLIENKKLYNIHSNQIEDAKVIVNQIIFGNRPQAVQISVPMQAGKTGTAIAVFLFLKSVVPNLKAFYVCANDQKNNRNQIKSDLGGINDFEHLSLSDRRKWESTDTPTLIVFDENHYGDGKEQTICDFLIKNKVFVKVNGEYIRNPDFSNLFLCLSGTGFSALSYMDFVFMQNLNSLHKINYNSTTLMLKNKKIEDCDPFIKKGKILWESNVLIYLAMCIKKYKGCYGIIRCNSKDANMLRFELGKKYGSNIDILYWNQSNPLNHQDYFKRQRPVFTIILIQNMCRMGATIDTKFIRFMAEYVSPTAYLATVVQGFMGRSLGYRKVNHNIKIFSQKSYAQAYTYWENDQKDVFMDFCKTNKINLSKRSMVVNEMNPKNLKILFRKYSSKLTNETIKSKIRKELGRHFPIRTLTKHTITRITKKGMFNPENVNNLSGVDSAIGSMAGVIFDGLDARIKTVKIVERIGKHPDVKGIKATPTCLFDIN